MGVQCQILLNKSKEGVYRPSQAVTGVLKYNIDKPTKFDNIELSFVGKGICQWSESDSDNTTYYKNKEDYVSIIKNIYKSRNDDTEFTGTYEYPFEFFLPENIPASFKNTICTIEYKIFAKFVKANFFETKYKFDAEVPVYGYLNPCSPEPLTFGLQKKLLSLTPQYKINVKVEIEKTFLIPGENITLNLIVHNESDVPINIKTELIRHFTYVSDRKRKKIVTDTVESTAGLSPLLKENSVSKLTCIVPTLPSLYSIQHTEIMIGEYRVKVTAKVPFPHINESVEIPVVIGERADHRGPAVGYYDDGNPSHTEVPEKDGKLDSDPSGKYEENWEKLQFS